MAMWISVGLAASSILATRRPHPIASRILGASSGHGTVKNWSGVISSTEWPRMRSRSTVVLKARTTPFDLRRMPGIRRQHDLHAATGPFAGSPAFSIRSTARHACLAPIDDRHRALRNIRRARCSFRPSRRRCNRSRRRTGALRPNGYDREPPPSTPRSAAFARATTSSKPEMNWTAFLDALLEMRGESDSPAAQTSAARD